MMDYTEEHTLWTSQNRTGFLTDNPQTVEALGPVGLKKASEVLTQSLSRVHESVMSL